MNTKVVHQVTPTCRIEAEGSTPVEVFEAISGLEKVFAIDTCGCCGGQRIHYEVIEAKGFKFHTARCGNRECHAEFRFGLKKDQKTLFPQVEYPDGHAQAGQLKPNGGWLIWQGDGEPAAPPPRQAAPPPRQNPPPSQPAKVAPPTGANGAPKAMPATGPELLARLRQYAAKLVADKRIDKEGVLLNWISAKGDREGGGPVIENWPGPFDYVPGWLREFEATLGKPVGVV